MQTEAIREDAWLTASKIVPLSYSFYVQSSAFAAHKLAMTCLAAVGMSGAQQGELGFEQIKSLLDLGGARGGCVWAAAACEHDFR